jgi:di/tricarboxylate transporter
VSRDLVVVGTLLLIAVVLFVRSRPRMDIVAVVMMTVLPLTGVISVSETLAGFSDPNIVLIATLFIIGESLVRTGVTHRLGDWLLERAGRKEVRLIPRLMAIVATIGAVMSSTAVVALFIPVVLRIARKTGLPPSRLMMPLSFAALISGMMTLVATAPNLVVNSELARHGFSGFGFFSFTPFGVAVLVAGIIYILAVRRFLTSVPTELISDTSRPHMVDWIEEYALTNREYRLRVAPASSLIGKALRQLDLRGSAGINIVGIERSTPFAHRTIHAVAATELEVGDVLLIDAFSGAANVEAFIIGFGLERLPLTGAYFLDQSQEIGMIEVIIPATSKLIGRTVVEAAFRSEFGLSAVGLRRGRTPLAAGAISERLQLGDTLLLIGPWRAIRRLQNEWKHLVVLGLPAEMDDIVAEASRAPYALLILVVVIALMVSGLVPNVIAALLGCLLLGVFRCIDLSSAYKSIHWQTLILIVGMMPFAVALQKSGGIEIAAAGLLTVLQDYGIHAVLATLFAITATVGLFISNTATAILMAPVAIAVANGLNASPYPFAMIVALAASTAFMTPVSSPVNSLIVGPGNYKFSDFVRIGVPFSFVALCICTFLVPILLPP